MAGQALVFRRVAAPGTVLARRHALWTVAARPNGIRTPPSSAHHAHHEAFVRSPFAGLTHKPHCEACEQAAVPRPQAPCAPPPRIVSTRGRRRVVNTSQPLLSPAQLFLSWLGGLGEYPSQWPSQWGPWRQLYCLKCQGSFQETHGTSFAGQTRHARDPRVGGVCVGRRVRHPRCGPRV